MSACIYSSASHTNVSLLSHDTYPSVIQHSRGGHLWVPVYTAVRHTWTYRYWVMPYRNSYRSLLQRALCMINELWHISWMSHGTCLWVIWRIVTESWHISISNPVIQHSCVSHQWVHAVHHMKVSWMSHGTNLSVLQHSCGSPPWVPVYTAVHHTWKYHEWVMAHIYQWFDTIVIVIGLFCKEPYTRDYILQKSPVF